MSEADGVAHAAHFLDVHTAMVTAVRSSITFKVCVGVVISHFFSTYVKVLCLDRAWEFDGRATVWLTTAFDFQRLLCG